MDMKNILKSFNFINSFLYNQKGKNILDPMSCIIIFSLLSFHDENCKLSIKNNSIIIQKPYHSQGFIRWYLNDKRDDICQLCHPIEKALEWYDFNEFNIKEILEESINGIDKLKECYSKENNTQIIIHALLHYKNIINKKLNNISYVQMNETDDFKKFNIFKDIWSKNDLKCITILIKELRIAKDNKTDCEYYIKSIYSLLEGKNKIKEKMISEIIDL